MKGPLGNIMQQAQKMQENLQKAQAEIAKLEVTGEAGGGAVKVTMNGRHEVRGVSIDPIAMEDLGMLEDLITAAVNDAVNRVAEMSQERLSEVSGGLNLPPGMKLPF